jgi:hypothetical protein
MEGESVVLSLKDRDDFGLAVVKSPKTVVRELVHVFPGVDLNEVISLPTVQKARHDLVKIGDEIEEEKDRLLETFMDFAKKFCALIKDKGYWADYIDPCSGLPMLTPNCNKVYSEVDGMEVMLKYKTMNCGCCKVLLHPKWGSGVYPASMFTTAPIELVNQIILPMCS